MKYDDASWHYGGDFPKELPKEAGATHIGMFVIWAWLNGLGGPLHVDECPEDVAAARERELTPGALFRQFCDEKFTDEDLNDEGNTFAAEYYGSSEGLNTAPGGYLSDYDEVFEGYPSPYHIPDAWESLDRLSPVLSRRLNEWRSRRVSV